MKKTMVALVVLFLGGIAQAAVDGYELNRKQNRTDELVERAEKLIEKASAKGKFYVYVPDKDFSATAIRQAEQDLWGEHFFVDEYYHHLMVAWN